MIDKKCFTTEWIDKKFIVHIPEHVRSAFLISSFPKTQDSRSRQMSRDSDAELRVSTGTMILDLNVSDVLGVGSKS